MKTLSLTIVMIITFGFANAQENMMSKKGVPILPEAGDWSVGFDMVPIIGSLGTLFHSNIKDEPVYSQLPYTLVGLYVKDSKTAYRLKLRIGVGSNSLDNNIKDDIGTATATNPFPMITDEWKRSNLNIAVGAGIQKSRGKGRLRGIYGAEVTIKLESGKSTFTYGNDITSTNNTPTTTDWNSPDTTGGYFSINPTYRITEMKNGSTFGVGVSGFIGAEYFFAPKMSISAEYGWGLMILSTGEGTVTSEYWDTTDNVVQTVLTKPTAGKTASSNLDVINSTALTLHLYF